MNRRHLLMGACALVCAPASAFALAAFAQDDIARKLINEPGGWNIYGTAQTNKRVKDDKVQGGQAMEIRIASAGGNPWDAAAESQITGKISKGDKIVAAVWARSKTADNAPANLTMRMQVSSPPSLPLVKSRSAWVRTGRCRLTNSLPPRTTRRKPPP